MTNPASVVAALQAAVDSLAEQLQAAERKEAASRAAYAADKQVCGHYRQQLHFARVRLSKATMNEDKAEALRQRMRDPLLTEEQRRAAEQAYFRELDRGSSDE